MVYSPMGELALNCTHSHSGPTLHKSKHFIRYCHLRASHLICPTVMHTDREAMCFINCMRVTIPKGTFKGRGTSQPLNPN